MTDLLEAMSRMAGETTQRGGVAVRQVGNGMEVLWIGLWGQTPFAEHFS
jgi:hypothetical protein